MTLRDFTDLPLDDLDRDGALRQAADELERTSGPASSRPRREESRQQRRSSGRRWRLQLSPRATWRS